MLRAVKPKNARSKRALLKREPKVIENAKTALFIRSANTSQLVNDALTDLYLLKKPQALHFTKKNNIRPFEDETSIEFLSQKNDASLFAVGSHSKKRPHNIVLGRMFDHHLLDMIEIGLDRFVSMSNFKTKKCASGMRPCLIFNGDLFDQQEEYVKLRNLLLDFFQGERADAVNLEGLEHVIVVTAGPMPEPNKMGRVFLRVYTVQLRKSGTKLPRVELEEMGPSMDFTMRRTQFAPDEVMKQALRVPAEIKKKKVKNVEHDELGDQFGRIHMERQDFSQLQTRKMKGLKRRADEDDDEDTASDNNDEDGDNTTNGHMTSVPAMSMASISAYDDDDDMSAKPSRKPKGKGKRTRSN